MKEYGYISDFLLNMLTEAVEKINRNSKYKELDNQILSCTEKLRARLDEDGQSVLNELLEAIAMEHLIFEQKLYKSGFCDGIVFSDKL